MSVPLLHSKTCLLAVLYVPYGHHGPTFSSGYSQVKECLSKQNPRIVFFESRYVLEHSYTCCNTQCLPETRERKGESK